MQNSKRFMEQIKLPSEAMDEFSYQEKRLTGLGIMEKLDTIATAYWQNRNRETYLASLEDVRLLAERAEVSVYTLHFLYMMTLGELLETEYQKEGIPESIFWDTMYDLHCKAIECHTVHRIWGTFVPAWYSGFWRKTIVKLGRLEYETKRYPKDTYQKGTFSIQPDDRVYNIHIPSEGALYKEAVLASLKNAYDFYGFSAGQIMPCMCHSWLLYPDNAEIFPQGSNLKTFFDLFDILDAEPDEAFHDCWRVFGKDYDGNPANLCSQTTLQTRIQKHLASGKTMGEGFAVLLFDGAKILTGTLIP